MKLAKYTLLFLLLAIFYGCDGGLGTQRNYILSQVEVEDEVQLNDEEPETTAERE